jgi:hypothetical protein
LLFQKKKESSCCDANGRQQTQTLLTVNKRRKSTTSKLRNSPHPSYPSSLAAAAPEQSHPPRACPFLPRVGTVVLVPILLHWWGVE